MGCPPFVEMATALKVFFSPEGSGMCTHQMATQIGEALCDGNGTLVKVYPVFSNTTPSRLEDRNMDSSKFEHHNITLHHESSVYCSFMISSILSKSSLHLLQMICLFGKMVQLTGQLHKPLPQEFRH